MQRNSILVLFVILLSAAHVMRDVQAQERGGTIRGKILYSGAPAKSSLISMAKDPNCLKINAGKKIYDETMVVNNQGALRNVFVHLKEGVEKKSYPAPAVPVVLDQKSCLYVPRVQGALLGQSLKITNSDQTLHNIHSQSPKYALNIAQPIAGMIYSMPLKSEDVMLKFKCEVHPWMVAYIGVLPHPYFSVSGNPGTYEMKNVPAGKYLVQAWHEKLGAQTRDVEVKTDSVLNVDFTFGGPSASADPGFTIAEVILPPQN